MGMGWMYRGRISGAALYQSMDLDRICLIAGGEPASEKKWKTIVTELSSFFVKKKWTLVYCGMGSGLSGSIAKNIIEQGGAVESVVVNGKEPPDMPSGSKVIAVSDFHERTRQLFDSTDAFLILPGGVGTLAELTQIAAWNGVGLMNKHVVVFDPDDWFSPIYEFYNKAYRMKISPVSDKQMFIKVRTLSQLKFHLTRCY
jgi:uncharacterized protein (TIGR00730 family)